MLILALALLAAAPDIELRADVRARSVTIEKKGEARLTVTTEPQGDNVVDVRAPKADGRTTLRDVRATVRAEARIADPARAPDRASPEPETSTPQ